MIAPLAELEKIKPGELVVYYVGYLARDRRDGDNPAHIAAAVAWRLHVERRVILTQRRIRDHLYEYIAIGRLPRLHEQPGLGPRPIRSGVAFLP